MIEPRRSIGNCDSRDRNQLQLRYVSVVGRYSFIVVLYTLRCYQVDDSKMSGPIFPEAGPSLSPDRPSLFELLADEQLRDLFHPVIRYVLSVSP